METVASHGAAQREATPETASSPWRAAPPQPAGGAEGDAQHKHEPPSTTEVVVPKQCFSCQMTRVVTMVGFGAYAQYQRSLLPRSAVGGRVFAGAFSAMLYGVGVYSLYEAFAED